MTNNRKSSRMMFGSHTDGLLGKPTARWPHVVSKLTRHSRTRDCDSQGLFQPLNGAVSAGDKLALRLGEFGVPLILWFKWTACPLFRLMFCVEPVSDLSKIRRPISGVCATSKVKSIVRPASSYQLKQSKLGTVFFCFKENHILQLKCWQLTFLQNTSESLKLP